MESNKGNRNSCPQGGIFPVTSTNWGPASWKTTLQVKTWEGLVDNKLTMSQWCFLKPATSWAGLRRVRPAGQGRRRKEVLIHPF